MASKYAPIFENSQIVLARVSQSRKPQRYFGSLPNRLPRNATCFHNRGHRPKPLWKTNCRYCKIMNTTGTVVSTTTGRTYTTPRGGSCRHNNLVYLLTCNKCKKQHVGQRYCPLMNRLSELLYYINKGDITQPLSRHFAKQDHRGQNIQVQILQHVPTLPELEKTKTLRLSREYHWIHQLCTMEPFGLNVMGK